MVVYGGLTFDDPFMCWYVEQRRLTIDMVMEGARGQPPAERERRIELVQQMVKGDIQTWMFCQDHGIDMGELLGGALLHALSQVLPAFDEWVTTGQAARLLRCSARHVRRLARGRQIDARIGPTGTWRCLASSVYGYKRRPQ